MNKILIVFGLKIVPNQNDLNNNNLTNVFYLVEVKINATGIIIYGG